MLATVSELSMMQSKAMSLQQDKDQKEEVLASAMARLEQGQPPTDSCEHDWERMQRDRMRRSQEIDLKMQRAQLEAQIPNMGIKTTAVPRPNSYMRNDLEIPRPYGQHPPFVPTAPGATMRHIVKR